jgi:hypothetical protein
MGLNFLSFVGLKKWGRFIIVQKVHYICVNAVFAELLARHYNVSPLMRCAVLSHPSHFILGFHLSLTFDWSKSKEVTVCTQMQDKVFYLKFGA